MRATLAPTPRPAPRRRRRAALDLQRRALPDANRDRVGRRERGLELDAAQIDHLDHAGVDRHAFARLHQSLRDLAGDGALQHGVVERLARHVDRGQRGPVRGARRIQVGLRGVERGLGDEALVDQRLVVVVLALRDFDLRAGRVGLFAGLAHARLVFGRLDARDHLAGGDGVAFAHREAVQFTGDARLDGAEFTALSVPEHRQRLRQCPARGDAPRQRARAAPRFRCGVAARGWPAGPCARRWRATRRRPPAPATRPR